MSWLLSDGQGKMYGPFAKAEIATRLRRYRVLRHYSNATRRACWAKAAESPFEGKGATT